ncbi:hypothetical protein [Nocardioides montaniterrae]
MLRGLLAPKALGLIALIVLVMGGLVVASVYDDARTDRKRPMFSSVVEMMQIQWDTVAQGKPITPLRMTGKDPARTFNGVSYRVQPGVTVEVKEIGGKPCVHGRDKHGDRTRWICVDRSLPRPQTGSLD